MSGHTRGPWALLLPNDLWVGRPIDDWAITVDDHDTWICTGPTWDADHSEESAANARLIAAAPDLLSALERVVGTVEHMYHTNPDPDGSLWADVIACRAAIAKATGSQP